MTARTILELVADLYTLDRRAAGPHPSGAEAYAAWLEAAGPGNGGELAAMDRAAFAAEYDRLRANDDAELEIYQRMVARERSCPIYEAALHMRAHLRQVASDTRVSVPQVLAWVQRWVAQAEAAAAPRYLVQVRGAFGGSAGGWRPGITGTLNQTGHDDRIASSFDRRDEADAAVEAVLSAGAAPEDVRVLDAER